MADFETAEGLPGGKGDRVAGKVALVTGAGSSAEGIGNGRGSAILLARHGAHVCLLDYNLEAAQETGRMIEAEGGTCFAIQGDVSVEADCQRAVAETIARYGRLDILVNVVGTSKVRGDATAVDLDEWDRGMAINIKSIVMTARYAVPEMRKTGGGSIINIGSITGLHGGHPNLFYATSKGTIVNMTRTMAGNHGPDGIRVNNVAPGFVYTPVVYGKGIPDDVRAYRSRISVLGTEGTGWDVGYAVLFLASDEARWITGVTLPVDAGVSAISPHFQTTTPNRNFGS
ncbi:SDR family NAD(P)-dependent oxidoreductase [Sphingobium sp.]|uniref:SDR family NAD(P)-dependent oxidoreductase n=1 Tax=Sphingobium sp. TaxID=1912891 RepID=UPI0026267CF4|nr:SDR family oxidoreductase [Sphingobium sp.]